MSGSARKRRVLRILTGGWRSDGRSSDGEEDKRRAAGDRRGAIGGGLAMDGTETMVKDVEWRGWGLQAARGTRWHPLPLSVCRHRHDGQPAVVMWEVI